MHRGMSCDDGKERGEYGTMQDANPTYSLDVPSNLYRDNAEIRERGKVGEFAHMQGLGEVWKAHSLSTTIHFKLKGQYIMFNCSNISSNDSIPVSMSFTVSQERWCGTVH